MEVDAYILVVVVLAAIVITWFVSRQQRPTSPRLENAIVDLQTQLAVVNDKLAHQNNTLFASINQSQQTIQEQFSQTQQIITEVTRKLTTVDETNKQIVGFASQLQSLEQVLKNPKQRGVLGEYFLEKVLESVLPPQNFKLQYPFKNGEVVDAAIFTKDYVIPVDAKFSLASYNKLVEAPTKGERDLYARQFKNDLKNRINETAKYIRPEEGTYEFAFMFVPADGVYYELLQLEIASNTGAEMTIIEYAFSKKVILVSPVTLFAYLQTVLQGLRALQIEESVKKIQTNLARMQKYLDRYTHNMGKLGTHLGHAMSSYEKSSLEMQNLNKEISTITARSTQIENSLPDVDESPNDTTAQLPLQSPTE